MIEISHLTKVYGEQKAVNDISFNVQKGEIVGFLGPNGAGKSTTMKIVTCYMPPTAGEVRVADMPVHENSLEVRGMIGYLPELNPLYHDMNVVDFIQYVALLRGIPRENQGSRVKEVIDICGLSDVLHKDIGQLSKGYKQRVGLAMAMVHDPEILILDEPTIGLDPNQVVDIRHLIKRLGREKTVVLSTHILSEVQATCNRAVIINRGKIVADSTIADLQRGAEKQEVISLELAAAADGVAEQLLKIDGVNDVKNVYPDAAADGNHYRIKASEEDGDIRERIFHTAVVNNWVIVGMAREMHSLEEVFHQLTM